jgi:hypothetical protein
MSQGPQVTTGILRRNIWPKILQVPASIRWLIFFLIFTTKYTEHKCLKSFQTEYFAQSLTPSLRCAVSLSIV